MFSFEMIESRFRTSNSFSSRKLFTLRVRSHCANRPVTSLYPIIGQTTKKSSPDHWLQSITFSKFVIGLYSFLRQAGQPFTNRTPDSGDAVPAHPVTINSRYSVDAE